MTLDPQARWVLDAAAQAYAEGRPKFETLSPEDARILYAETRPGVTPAAPDIAAVEDLTVPGPGGSIPVRYYRPLASIADAALPVVVFYHGGGWVFGDIDTHDVLCRLLANAANAAVFSVDYRMGPEAKFPAAVDDAYAVARWVGDGAGSRAVAATRIAVAGDSAGGNLAAVVCLMARDEGPKLAYQALIYGATDMRRGAVSHGEFADDRLQRRFAIEMFLQPRERQFHYLSSSAV